MQLPDEELINWIDLDQEDELDDFEEEAFDENYGLNLAKDENDIDDEDEYDEQLEDYFSTNLVY